MTNALRVGFIGLGNVALAHLEGYRQLDQITVVADNLGYGDRFIPRLIDVMMKINGVKN